jgi:hypothetical protein
MCKETENLTQKQWHEVYYDQSQQAVLVDNQDGLWMIGKVSKTDLESHIFSHGSEGTDWRWSISYGWDKYEGRVIPEETKELTVDIEDWLEHYVETHHSNLLEIVP